MGLADPTLLGPETTGAMVWSHAGRWGAATLGVMLQRSRTLTPLRQWCETLHDKSRRAVEAFVGVQFSPYLVQACLLDVMQHNPALATTGLRRSFHPTDDLGGDDTTIEVDTAEATVSVRFQRDDINVCCVIAVPRTGFPLRPATLQQDGIKAKSLRAGISIAQWQGMMLRMSATLLRGAGSGGPTGGSGNVSGGENAGSAFWQCVQFFCENMMRVFDGVEPCPVCYTVVSAESNHELPSMRCSVCKNMCYHRACLHKWWSESGQTVCPTCRSPWFFTGAQAPSAAAAGAF
jgi:hypothetical protein